MINSPVTTLHVRRTDTARIKAALDALGRGEAEIGPPGGSWSTIYDPACVDNDNATAERAAALSAKLETPALVVSLIKYNQLSLEIWIAGRREIHYELDLDPSRGNPSPEKTDRAAEGIARQLLPICKPGTAVEQLDRTLRALEVSSGQYEKSPQQRVDEAEQVIRAIASMPEIPPLPPMTRDEARRRLQATNFTTRRDLTEMLGFTDAALTESMQRGLSSIASLAASERARGDDDRERYWREKEALRTEWLRGGAAAIRTGMQKEIDELEDDVEGKLNRALAEDLRFQAAARKQHQRLPARILAKAQASLAAPPRPMRAMFVLDVWADLAQALDIPPELAESDEPP